MKEHTPGPWTVVPASGSDETFSIRSVPNNEIVCWVEPWKPDVDEQDARLIAAAPDLLAICEELAKDSYGIAIGTLERLNAAIAKARG